MAIPLKNGADLYNFEVLRMRFHNLGADPTSDFGVGQVYFNTSTSEGSGKRVRIYDGSAFRSLAYLDEFTALQTKVNAFLDGGVDADGVLENLAEIQKFLDNYSSATDLSEILDTKLDKTGGTITGTGLAPLIINTSASDSSIVFRVNSTSKTQIGYSPSIGSFIFNYASSKSLGIKDDGTPHFNGNTLLHSGNVGEYALKKGAGGYRLDIDTPLASNEADFHAYFQRIGTGLDTSSSDVGSARKGVIRLAGGDSESQLLFDHFEGKMYLRNYGESSWSNWKTIAFTDSNVASATKLETARTIWGQSFDGTAGISGDLAFPVESKLYWAQKANYYIGASYTLNNGSPNIDYAGYSGHVFRTKGDTIRMLINPSGNVTIGDTDRASTNYKLFVKGNAMFLSGVYLPNGVPIYVQDSSAANKAALYMDASNNYRFGDSALFINSSGNVTIGVSDLAGSGTKLLVSGSRSSMSWVTDNCQLIITDSTNTNYRLGLAVLSGGSAAVMQSANKGVGAIPLLINPSGGNVLIGTTTDDGLHKLQVTGGILASRALSVGSFLNINRNSLSGALINSTKMAVEIETYSTHVSFKAFDTTNTRVGHIEIDASGDVHIPGNLIVEGEVSAGGAGEEGDTGTGTGGGDALIYSQEFTPTTTSITITHNLSATKGVIVQVWEKNGNYWDMVLVDVEEVDTNTVTLFFGKTETTVHKVVIMG